MLKVSKLSVVIDNTVVVDDISFTVSTGETLAITDRAYILSDGSILASGTSEQVGSDPLVRRHYLGEDFRL